MDGIALAISLKLSNVNFLNFSSAFIEAKLMKLNSNQAHGPDDVSPRVLKACTPQLIGVLHHVFNMSLSLERVPMMWKVPWVCSP